MHATLVIRVLFLCPRVSFESALLDSTTGFYVIVVLTGQASRLEKKVTVHLRPSKGQESEYKNLAARSCEDAKRMLLLLLLLQLAK